MEKSYALVATNKSILKLLNCTNTILNNLMNEMCGGERVR